MRYDFHVTASTMDDANRQALQVAQKFFGKNEFRLSTGSAEPTFYLDDGTILEVVVRFSARSPYEA